MGQLAWRELLAVQGYAVVRGVTLGSDNAALRELGACLGRTSVTTVSKPGQPNVEADGINRVEAMDLPGIDPAGRPILSTTADLFPLHTDDTFVARPARFVLMHCWKADLDGGGVSQVANICDFLPGMDAEHVETLRTPGFASPFGNAPVLFRDEAASQPQCIRFNHRDFSSFAERYGPPLQASQQAALTALLQAARECTTDVRLQAGDCLVVDNWRVLHGRTAFDPGSGRLLKRLRIA